MKKILIADASKASLVMTSEVFKDHYPGIQVLVARNSSEAIYLAKSTENIDAFIVDYDLPDKNGAETALMLKKISKIPTLLTAFAKDDVAQQIETVLAKYPDCRSWLKKPVNPEVVIAVAQRYCDGKIRAQKRVSCQLPALTKLELTPPPQKKEKKTEVKKASPKAAKSASVSAEENTEFQHIYFYGLVEDCSLSGVKLKPNKHAASELVNWSQLLDKIESVAVDNKVVIKLPMPEDIEFGNIIEPSKAQIVNFEKENHPNLQNKGKLSHKNSVKKNSPETKWQEFCGRIAWTSTESGERCMGIEFDDQALSKQLFEAVIAHQTKLRKTQHGQSILKTARLA